MANRQVRLVIGLITPLVALWLANWVDGHFVFEARQNAGRDYDFVGQLVASNAGLLATALLTLAVAYVAIWSRSRIVAVLDIVLGGFYGLLLALVALLAARVNDAPPLAPEPVARFLNDRYFEISMGSIGSVPIVGAAMLVAGVVTLVLSYRPVVASPVESEPVES